MDMACDVFILSPAACLDDAKNMETHAIQKFVIIELTIVGMLIHFIASVLSSSPS